MSNDTSAEMVCKQPAVTPGWSDWYGCFKVLKGLPDRPAFTVPRGIVAVSQPWLTREILATIEGRLSKYRFPLFRVRDVFMRWPIFVYPNGETHTCTGVDLEELFGAAVAFSTPDGCYPSRRWRLSLASYYVTVYRNPNLPQVAGRKVRGGAVPQIAPVTAEEIERAWVKFLAR